MRPTSILFLWIAAWCSSEMRGYSQGNLPTDRDKKQFVVVADPESKFATWIDGNAKLRAVKQATAFTFLAPNSKLYESRYAALYGNKFPIVVYMRSDGGVIYFADRDTMPVSAEALYSEMARAAELARNAEQASPLLSNEIEADLSEDCPDGFCPAPPNRNEDQSIRFPLLRPFSPKVTDPFDGAVSGLFSDSIGSGIWLVFSIVALGVVGLFAILLFGAMVVVVKWIK
jgi:hypothetical protein